MKNNTANFFKGPYWLCNIEYTMRGVKNCKGEKPRAAELGLEQETKAHVMPGRRKFPFVMVMYANLGGGAGQSKVWPAMHANLGRAGQSKSSSPVGNACKLGPDQAKAKASSKNKITD